VTVQEIITALIGVPGNVEIEIVDDDGVAAQLTAIKITSYSGILYGEAVIDRKMVADNETAVTS